MGFNDILSELRAGDIRNLYVLEGEDEYLKSKILISLEKLLIEPSAKSLDKVTIDVDKKAVETTINRIIDEIKTPSFLSKRKLVIVKKSGIFSLKSISDEIRTQIEDLVGALSSGCTLVFIEDKIDKRKKWLVKLINDNGLAAQISKPELDALRIWVRKRFKEHGIKLTHDATDVFIQRNERELFSMENESEKLILYCKHEGIKELNSKDIINIGSTDLKESIFNLFDSVSSGNAGEALEIFNNLISQKEPIQLILFMLARHIKQLICAKDIGNSKDIITELKVPPFVASKLTRQCASSTLTELENMYLKCHEFDVLIKSSMINDKMAIEILLSEFSNSMKVS